MALHTEIEPVFDVAFDFVTSNLSWVFLLGSNLFVLVSVARDLHAARQGADRRSRGQTGLRVLRLVRHAVRRGHGHRPDVLRRGRTADPLRRSSGRHRRGERGAHRLAPALAAAADDAQAAASLAMAATILHYGIHPWGSYAIVGLALAIFAFNKGLPLTMRSIFYPALSNPFGREDANFNYLRITPRYPRSRPPETSG